MESYGVLIMVGFFTNGQVEHILQKKRYTGKLLWSFSEAAGSWLLVIIKLLVKNIKMQEELYSDQRSM